MPNKVIGIKANYYPEKRNFSELGIEGFDFIKKNDFYKFLAYPYFKIFNKTHPQWLNLFMDFDLGKYDCLHFFNAVSLGKKPWITTFEYYLPRGAHQMGEFPSEQKYIDRSLKALASDACKQIIAISTHAKAAQIAYLKNYDVHISNAIIAKIVVLHPPQKLLVNEVKTNQKKAGLNCVLVGADFFRKGGLETLEVIAELLAQKMDISLSIVSSLQYGDYASKSTEADLIRVKALIDKYPSISHYSSLPNAAVLALFKKADLALLPSYDETYGYAVLEAQACGCPVITTNGGAFKEMNDDDCGWVIEVPLINNRSIPYGDEAKKEFQTLVKKALKVILEEAIVNKDALLIKSENCLNRIKNNHSIDKAVNTLKDIYKNAITQ